jgi:leucyl-tRNA synthetase
MNGKPYNHLRIEKKWQDTWNKKNLYKVPDSDKQKKNYYQLVEFPYPSGNLHVGHWYAFAVPDILARFERMRGKNVLYPIGFDAFGLPAENAAIKRGINPRLWTYKNIAHMRKQIMSMGTMFDMSREVITCDPGYYKWTQWQFLQMVKKGLVYRKPTLANWCPQDKTVLANEQVVGGKCERCGADVVQKEMPQWNIAITKYADRLIDDLDPLDWPEAIKESQRNWIGRSEGAEIDFPVLSDDLTGRDFVFLHGYKCSVSQNFWPKLKQEIEKRGGTVTALDLPNPSTPDFKKQIAFLKGKCTFGKKTTIVGHSLGATLILKLIPEIDPVGLIVLVAPVLKPEFLDNKKRDAIKKSNDWKFDFETIKNKSNAAIVIEDTADHIVPESQTKEMARLLGATLKTVTAQETHFAAEHEPAILNALLPRIPVFTTRPDTIFGATFLVLAPEHLWVKLALTHKLIKNASEVEQYITNTTKKTDLERQENKEKTGVELKGVTATNPANGNKIPVFIADYVLPQYGTGAIMAVPAHDDRDYAFAKKHKLPVVQVVTQVVRKTKGPDAFREGEPVTVRRAVMCIVKHWEKDEYLVQTMKGHDVRTFISGGIEEGETVEEAAIREVKEESGYQHIEIERAIPGIRTIEFYHLQKKTNRRPEMHYMLMKLTDGEQVALSQEENDKHENHWLPFSELKDFLSLGETTGLLDRIHKTEPEIHDKNGFLCNSGAFSGMHNEDAKRVITKTFGTPKKTYRLRDWIVSRQRYWGVPIPMIHCKHCEKSTGNGYHSVPEKDLPVLLPRISNYLPAGEGKSPLAKATRWVKVRCPHCKKMAERETDTFDTFVDSSWYFNRYVDPNNKKQFANPKKLENWMPVDLYSGGAEHTTMHVLYSRFWHKVLYDLKLVKDKEPYTRRMNRGLILGPDGQKMSKSKGNVIDPDDVVKKLGADTLRLYLAFIGPYNEPGSYPWSQEGISGTRRFIERVWKLREKIVKQTEEDVERELHYAIQKITETTVDMKFNAGIATLMTLMNVFDKKNLTLAQYETFLKLLAPFAPHVTEELWTLQGRKQSIHLAPWPKWNPAKLVKSMITIAIQVNGKLRGTVDVKADASQAVVLSASRDKVGQWLLDGEVKKEVYIPGKLVNFVVTGK